MLDNSNTCISMLQNTLEKFDIKDYFTPSSVLRSTFYFLHSECMKKYLNAHLKTNKMFIKRRKRKFDELFGLHAVE